MRDEEGETLISQDVYDEILKGTDRKATYYVKSEHMAKKAMVELVKSGYASFFFLRDEEARDWWSKLVKDATTKVEERKQKIAEYEIKMRVWNRLSIDERKTLGIRKPAKPKP